MTEPMQPRPPETDEELRLRIRNGIAAMVYQYLVNVRRQDDAVAREVSMDAGDKAAQATLAEMNWWNVW